VRRVTIPALVATVGLLLLADFVVVNPALGALSGAAVQVVVAVAGGAALAGVGSLAWRHVRALAWFDGSRWAAVAVLSGMVVMLVAGLRPGSSGAADPAVQWLLAGLLLPIGATLFGILFVTTLLAVRRSAAQRSREATVMVIAAAAVLVLLLPVGGAAGAWLSDAAAWTLAVPIGGVFRGILIGVAIVVAVSAARTLVGVGPADD
jgi:hypothetical protein